jgi:hypothetical protein
MNLVAHLDMDEALAGLTPEVQRRRLLGGLEQMMR